MKLPPDPDFRPNRARAIFLNGRIDQSTLDRIVPEILKIDGSEPLTLYIDSPGGITLYANRLRQMFGAPTQDSRSPRRLITIATGFVASAASDLLIAGDYTLAYEHAVLLMHGVRQSPNSEITTETAANLAHTLASSNEQYALTLAGDCVSTFFFRVADAFDRFQHLRETTQDPRLRDVDCFVRVNEDRFSREIRELLHRAASQCYQLEALSQSVLAAISPMLTDTNAVSRFADVEAAIFKAILDYELKSHPDESWSFGERGFEGLQQKAHLLIDQTADRHKAQVESLVKRWGAFFVTDDELAAAREHPAESQRDVIRRHCAPRIQQFWFFLVALCRNLQTADFYLSAEEAYWLGFIDEIIGRPDLPNPRMFAEYAPDPDPAQEQP